MKSVIYSINGDLAVGSARAIYRTGGEQPLHINLPTGMRMISSLSYNHRGDELAAAIGRTIVIFYLNGDVIQAINEDSQVLSVSYHSEGYRLVAGLSNGTVNLWTPRGTKRVRPIRESGV